MKCEQAASAEALVGCGRKEGGSRVTEWVMEHKLHTGILRGQSVSNSRSFCETCLCCSLASRSR